MKASLGKVTKEAEGYKVRLERIYQHDINTVWEAITDPEKMKYWFTDIEMDFKLGGKMTFWFRDAAKSESHGEVIKIDPPHEFSFSWENEVALIQLTEEGKDKCKMVFTYSKLNEEYAASAPAGLHWMLDELDDVLDGKRVIHPFGIEVFLPEQEKLQNAYADVVYKQFPDLLKYKPIVVEKTYNASVERVWQAITDRDQMKQWYFDLPDFKAEPGFEFQFFGQGSKGENYLHLCKVTEVIPEKKLTYSWAYEGYPGSSFVTFELFDEGNKTRCKLTHKGLASFQIDNPDFARSSFNEGWNEIIGKMLKEFVEK